MSEMRPEQRNHRQRGQAMVFFALLSTVLIGFLAIVIDVGNLYLTRRNLQNTADAAALIGAQNRDGDSLMLDGTGAVPDALLYAGKNGYPGLVSRSNSIGDNTTWVPSSANGVKVDWPPTSGNHAGDSGYLEVTCARTVNSFFAAIFGANPVRIEARAVARGRGRFAEAAIIALENDPQALKIGGSSTSFVEGSIYSHGDVFAHSGLMDATGYVYARGDIDMAGLSASSQTRVLENAPELFDPNWPTPEVVSSGPGTRWRSVDAATDPQGWRHIYPGTYEEIFINSGNRVMFHPGIYRVTGGVSGKNFKIEGVACGKSPFPMSDPNDPPHGDPVSFVLDDGVTFETTASAVVRFRSAMWITDEGNNERAANNLVIRSREDQNAVKIVGNGSVSLLGTIYAPAGAISLAGSAGGSVRGQVVGGRVTLLGGAGTVVSYDPNNVPLTKRTWLVE